MKTLLLLACFAFCSCAQTVFYRNGEKIAMFQGDMKNVEYVDGDVHWSAGDVNHSKATLAQGKAATGKIGAVGTAAASAGILTLIK